jgi:polysaccharide pyruvyl transferase WcaK-like protein
MNNVAILSKENLSIETFNLDNKSFSSKISNNIGNFAFFYAIKKIIKNPKIYYDSHSIEEINECNCLIVPSANWLSSYFDPTGTLEYLSNVKIPIIFLGLGCQAENYEQEVKLHEKSSLFLNFIKKNNCEVACRGSFTQDFLKKQNINSTIIGCVSNLINQEPELKIKLQEKWLNTKHYCCLGNNINEECPIKSKAEVILFKLGTRHGFYIQQSYDSIISAIRFNNSYSKNSTLNLKRKVESDYFDVDDFEKTILQKTRFYVSIEQWMEDVSRMDLCFGTRIHGNIIAHQSSCPSIVVYHDSRTRELAETMEYPRVSVEEFINIRSIEELKEKSNCDYDLYENRREELKNNLINLFSKYGVEIN